MKRHKRFLRAALLSGGLLWQCPAVPHPVTDQTGRDFILFTSREVREWNRARSAGEEKIERRDAIEDHGAPTCASRPDPATAVGVSPQINILAPKVDQPLKPPVDIDLQFVASAGSPIRPDSFRVCYVGFLTVDITQRITNHVIVSADGLRVTGAKLPRGHHHLVMLIEDQAGHIGRREALFNIL